MNSLKEYMIKFRKTSFKDTFIILNVDVFPQLSNYVELLANITFEDGSYHTYYGDVKNVISAFLTYYVCVTDDVLVEADKCSNVMNRNELLALIDRTIGVHQSRHIYFGRKFLPVQSPMEKQAYEEIEELYNIHLKKLFDLKSHIDKLDKQEKVDNFAKAHFKISLNGCSDVFKMTHTFLSMMLADRIYQITVSVEEIQLRLKNNLHKVQTECNEKLHALLQLLYDKNKDMLQVSRQDRKCSVDYAEAASGIDRIRSKIEEYSYDPPLSRLEEEVAYWTERVNEFHNIANRLIKLKKDLEDVAKQEEIYNSMKTTELPGSKRQCWLSMGDNFSKRNKYLKEQIIQAAKPLITYFSVLGSDRIFYSDNVGHFYVDEFNHQVYFYDYGLNVYHLNCEGEFMQVTGKDKYYFDTNGRYILSPEGEKVYQSAPCTSAYKMTSSGLLLKTTKDCGHSEKWNNECRFHIKDPRSGERLPNLDNIDIKRTLNPEVVKYLWDSFGHVLPYALHDVGRIRTKNPIQLLAHKVLYHKYNKTISELAQKKKEAQQHRANIFKERKDRAIAASKAWKAKQVPRRKPEESYNTDDQVVYDAHDASYLFQAAMNYMEYSGGSRV